MIQGKRAGRLESLDGETLMSAEIFELSSSILESRKIVIDSDLER